jgi:hypothetical protein
MNTLTQSNQPHQIKQSPRACNPIPLRWLNVLHLHLAGKSAKEIAFRTGFSLSYVYVVLNHKDVGYMRQQLLANTQQEFEALYERIVQSVRDDLDSGDPERISDARKDWLKAHGKVSKEDAANLNIHLTAEDVVMQIQNGTKNERS